MSFDLRRQLAGSEVIFLSLTLSKVMTSQFPILLSKNWPCSGVIPLTKAFMNFQAG